LAAEPLICVIDDDASVCKALVGLIVSMGYRCSGFASAESALASNEAAEAACFLTDIHMPGLDGFALKRLLDSRGYDAGVIMMTARVEQHLELRALEAGAVCFLRKPLRAGELARGLALALKAK
jgi:FixJ family two-component response regulator